MKNGQQAIENIKKQTVKLFEENRRTKDGFQYTVPSEETYPYQWLWDSCFHAIVLSYFDIESAKKELLSVISHQRPDGLIPHMIYWEKPKDGIGGERLNINWGHEGHSSITQPPMIAYAAWCIYQKDQDKNFLDKLYQSLFHYYRYLLHERDPHERNLAGIINPDESGEDNSPRFDLLLDLPPKHELQTNYEKRMDLVQENRKCEFDAPFCMRNFFWVKDVPFNAILAENLRSLARIAEKLNYAYDAEYFDKKSQDVADAMRELMLEDGLYWSTYGEHYKKIKTKTWAIFMPLFAKIPTQDEARALVDNYLLNKEEFKSEFITPTVALNEPSYDPEGFWRGPVWVGANWFVYHGLKKYGFNEEAEMVRNSAVALVEKSGFREQFNPHTGEGQGAQGFTWNGLIIDMVD